MFEVKPTSGQSTPAMYQEIESQLKALLADERDLVANAANTASLVFHVLPDVNWVGFYILMGGELVLGPFQGKPACTRIELGKGVCGAAAQSRETVVVPDVNAFSGHIACDRASQSEIVVPLLSDGRLVGVLDIDSPVKNRFSDEDRAGCERLAAAFLAATDA
jgi:GAF domain-containing protein